MDFNHIWRQKLKSKLLWVFLIFSVMILGSCSLASKEKLNTIENYKDTEIGKVNNKKNETEEIINSKKHDEILEQIVNDIKVESGVEEDIELSDIKRIRDTYYVIVCFKQRQRI
jgi:hypothetical protein